LGQRLGDDQSEALEEGRKDENIVRRALMRRLSTEPGVKILDVLIKDKKTHIAVGVQWEVNDKITGISIFDLPPIFELSHVHNEADEDVGKVDEIILPTGGAPTAILAVGGFLGIGSHYVAVPLSRLRMGPRDRWVMLGATKEYLRTLPPFTYTAAAQR
jgi:hypothetical protein